MTNVQIPMTNRPGKKVSAALAGLAGRMLVDCGAATPAGAAEAVADGAARVVVGLETLPTFGALKAIAAAIGTERIVFSLDLREGQPVLRPGAPHHGSPLELARAAVEAGADLGLVAAIRRAHPELELLAGGGVGSLADLERLADAGCDGALVAAALHAGGLDRRDLDAVRRREPARLGRHSSDSR